MNRRKLIALLMAICLISCLALAMTGCGSRKDTAEEEPVAEEVNEKEEPEAEEESAKVMYVTAEDGLLLRKGPGTENEVVTVLSYGQEIKAEKTENGWAYTTVDGKKGWCSMEYLTENKVASRSGASKSTAPDKLVEPTNTSVEGYHGYVDSKEGLNMRFGPGESYNIITVIPDKTELTELGWDEGWVYVQYNNQYGWINAHYFMLEGGREKPVIYLYPEKTTDASVRITLTDGSFTQCIPAGDGNGVWNVTAEPDGTLTDKASGKTYDYIFWESTDSADYDWSEGYVVKGSESEAFLLMILPKMGLKKSEYTEFIDYWLPRLQKNKYNLITFQTARYTEKAVLDVSPEPDSVLRVFMAFRKVDGPMSVAEPKIVPFERKGFTVVEWGGAEVL